MNASSHSATALSVGVIFGDPQPSGDHLIVDSVYRALRATGYAQLLSLKAYCDNGRVTLQGRVPTYYLKQVAQSALRSIDGVRDVDNDVKVNNDKK